MNKKKKNSMFYISNKNNNEITPLFVNYINLTNQHHSTHIKCTKNVSIESPIQIETFHKTQNTPKCVILLFLFVFSIVHKWYQIKFDIKNSFYIYSNINIFEYWKKNDWIKNRPITWNARKFDKFCSDRNQSIFIF